MSALTSGKLCKINIPNSEKCLANGQMSPSLSKKIQLFGNNPLTKVPKEHHLQNNHKILISGGASSGAILVWSGEESQEDVRFVVNSHQPIFFKDSLYCLQ